jgi:hypothetical protein
MSSVLLCWNSSLWVEASVGVFLKKWKLLLLPWDSKPKAHEFCSKHVYESELLHLFLRQRIRMVIILSYLFQCFRKSELLPVFRLWTRWSMSRFHSVYLLLRSLFLHLLLYWLILWDKERKRTWWNSMSYFSCFFKNSWASYWLLKTENQNVLWVWVNFIRYVHNFISCF